MSEKAITSRVNENSVVITISKELILGEFEDFYSENYRVKNKKKFFEKVGEQICESIENEDLLNGVVDTVVSFEDCVKELDDEE